MAATSEVSQDEGTTQSAPKAPWLPPRWFIHFAWRFHRAYYRVTGGRRGLWPPALGKWGTMRVTTSGRRTGKPRSVILGYYEDGPNLVTLAMNGWGDAEPAWWLNLQAQPDVDVELRNGKRRVRARKAEGEERTRLWARWREHGHGEGLDGYATLRSRETAVVVLEPASS
jgi:deazaflavin-dependent oxidoreductase (nitroreductase family)